ncbi:MAG: methyltransferase domain-containing protein [Candidatus Spechtbacterales bacterium]|nr:methyltransferase domain-containing protein [Candidatus Spechtbacterales bacterium]
MTSEEKMSFLDPDKLVGHFHLEEGMNVADFGSGAGHFALAMARIVGPEGSINAIDVRKSILSVLEGHARIEGLVQIKSIEGNLEKSKGSTLQDESVDMVLISNLLHQAEDIDKIIKEAFRILKKNGKLFVVDWKKDSFLGPKNRISEEEVRDVVKQNNFTFKRNIDAGNTHYALEFSK